MRRGGTPDEGTRRGNGGLRNGGMEELGREHMTKPAERYRLRKVPKSVLQIEKRPCYDGALPESGEIRIRAGGSMRFGTEGAPVQGQGCEFFGGMSDKKGDTGGNGKTGRVWFFILRI